MGEFFPNAEAVPDNYRERAENVNSLYSVVCAEVKLDSVFSEFYESEELDDDTPVFNGEKPIHFTYSPYDIDQKVQTCEDALAIAKRTYNGVVEFEEDAWIPEELLPAPVDFEDLEEPETRVNRRLDHLSRVIGLLDERLDKLRAPCDRPEEVLHIGYEIGGAQANLDAEREDSLTYKLMRTLENKDPKTRRKETEKAFSAADSCRANTERDLNEISFILGAGTQTLDPPAQMTSEMEDLEAAFRQSPDQDFVTAQEISDDADTDDDIFRTFADTSETEDSCALKEVGEIEEEEIKEATTKYDTASAKQLNRIDDAEKEYHKSTNNKTFRNDLRNFWQTTKSKFSKQSAEAEQPESAQLSEKKTQVGIALGKISVVLGFSGQLQDQTFKYLSDNPFDSPSSVYFSKMNTIREAQASRMKILDQENEPRVSMSTIELQMSVVSILEAIKEENKRLSRQRR